jgi:hypothetical protein
MPAGGFAGIALKAGMTAIPEGNNLRVEIRISNEGDEDALKILPTIRWEDQTQVLGLAPYIAIGGSGKWITSFKAPETKKLQGSYPLFIMVEYMDRRNYPVSMVGISPVHYGKPSLETSPILKLERFSGQEQSLQLKMVLRNISAKPISVVCRIYSPLELEAVNAEKNLLLKRDETREMVFNFQNKGALPGSRYEIYGIAEFNDDQRHVTKIASEIISVPPDEKGNKIASQIAGILMVIMVLFLITLYAELRRVPKEN